MLYKSILYDEGEFDTSLEDVINPYSSIPDNLKILKNLALSNIKEESSTFHNAIRWNMMILPNIKRYSDNREITDVFGKFNVPVRKIINTNFDDSSDVLVIFCIHNFL